jgi:multicomponent Na+:H+ antiporter subunit E
MALTLVWVLLSERLSVFVVVTGIAASILCLSFSRRYLPFKEITNVRFKKLVTYPFYLIGQVYLSGFYVIRIIITGARVDMAEFKTDISNEFLRVILANSITLTPGSILLDLKGDTLTALWLRKKSDPAGHENVGEILKGGLEKRLLKAEKQE